MLWIMDTIRRRSKNISMYSNTNKSNRKGDEKILSESLYEKRMNEFKKMGVTIKHRMDSNTVELYINNILISTGMYMYINKELSDEAKHINIFPDEENKWDNFYNN